MDLVALEGRLSEVGFFVLQLLNLITQTSTVVKSYHANFEKFRNIVITKRKR
jgi:hypothetical protein